MTTPTPTYRWVNLFPVAQTEQLVYFKAYVNQATNQVAGWVTRAGLTEPYSYSVYWLDAAGKVQTGSRGTWQHADWAVQGAVARVTAGGAVLEQVTHLPSRQLPPLSQIRTIMARHLWPGRV